MDMGNFRQARVREDGPILIKPQRAEKRDPSRRGTAPHGYHISVPER